MHSFHRRKWTTTASKYLNVKSTQINLLCSQQKLKQVCEQLEDQKQQALDDNLTVEALRQEALQDPLSYLKSILTINDKSGKGKQRVNNILSKYF